MRRVFDGLHVLADDDPRWTLSPIEQAEAACKGGASVIQLRVKHEGDQQQLEWAKSIREITQRFDIPFMINDRFDLALACGADGVHLGQTDLAPERIPDSARARLAIGRSTHSEEDANRALKESVDYVAFGPIFETTSKASEYPTQGLTRLEEIAGIVAPLPLIAIGGLGPGNLADIRRAGARGAAVISAVCGAKDSSKARAMTAELAALLAREVPMDGAGI